MFSIFKMIDIPACWVLVGSGHPPHLRWLDHKEGVSESILDSCLVLVESRQPLQSAAVVYLHRLNTNWFGGVLHILSAIHDSKNKTFKDMAQPGSTVIGWCDARKSSPLRLGTRTTSPSFHGDGKWPVVKHLIFVASNSTARQSSFKLAAVSVNCDVKEGAIFLNDLEAKSFKIKCDTKISWGILILDYRVVQRNIWGPVAKVVVDGEEANFRFADVGRTMGHNCEVVVINEGAEDRAHSVVEGTAPRLVLAVEVSKDEYICVKLLKKMPYHNRGHLNGLHDLKLVEQASKVYGYDPETKRQSSQWLEPGEPIFKKVGMIKSKLKCLLITFFDVKGLVHYEFMPKG
ncbi:hypothetical protein LAZ67_13000592 [Cordylochernes scorpioides]|uniref:Uncharacterized protein n=1 Tax=Cordylochernes scorpioides TaxID=51811 RepID=A0ABY6L7Y5_9ARAC|nr:hypothetical protein LAZ67_13000592 [Cordylochernes scorpioides]